MRFFIIIIYCSFVSNLFAQKISSNKKAQQAYELAAKHLRLNNLDEATKQLQKAIQLDETYATAYQQLGDIYRKQEKYNLATEAYRQVLKVDSALTALTYFGLGESLLFTGNYQEAIVALKNYQKIGKLAPKSLQLVNKYILDCEFSTTNLRADTLWTITKLPKEINTPNDEYFPQLTADNKTLIFTRKTSNQENFYESNFENDHWSDAKKLEGLVNSEEYNEGAHCISPDGKYLYFTGCNRPNGLGSCDIYVSKKENDRWSTPHNLGPQINTKGWEAQPSISADGKTLYFVSNRAGGYGGYDLYKSHLNEKGHWSRPVNLAPHINTPYDESAPYIHADNQSLYFASDGWPGFGRKDIFKSTVDSANNWSTPQNLGPLINNYQEQMSMHVNMNGTVAHLSTQDSLGKYNIYSLQLPRRAMPQPVAYILGTILHADNKNPIEAKISVTNTTTQKVVFDNLNDPADGKYLATLPLGHDYAVHIQKEGYLFESKQYALQEFKMNQEEFVDTTLLAPIAADAQAILHNIYFESNKYDLLPTSLSDLSILINFLFLNPKVSIEISGHTDHTGNKQYNQLLSEKRAKAVVDYLIAHGIAESRLSALGYGDSKPVADNASEEGRQRNRRTEFKITQTP